MARLRIFLENEEARNRIIQTIENEGVCDKKKKNWVVLKLSEVGRTSSPNLDMVVTGEAEKKKRMLEVEKDNAGDDDMEEFFCSICLCECETNEVIVKLPCSHIFHEDCISAWTYNHVHCPLCNFDLVANYDNGSTDDLEEGKQHMTYIDASEEEERI